MSYDSNLDLTLEIDDHDNTGFDVTKQFRLREKLVEYKHGVTTKYVVDSVHVQTPKRRRINATQAVMENDAATRCAVDDGADTADDGSSM